jgi:hypothetical protein
VVTQSDRAVLPLKLLFDEVLRTRERHARSLQRKRTGSAEVVRSRRAAMLALEDYIAALRSRELPVPPKMQRDLTMLRNLCADGVPRRTL